MLGSPGAGQAIKATDPRARILHGARTLFRTTNCLRIAGVHHTAEPEVPSKLSAVAILERNDPALPEVLHLSGRCEDESASKLHTRAHAPL